MEQPHRISNARLARLQAQTGLVIAAYLVLHMTNTLAALFGEARYDGVQRVVRHVYQNPVVEPLLLLALVVHIGVGVARFRRRTSGEAAPLRVRLHRYAAYLLTLVIIGHVAATRLPALLYDIHVGFRALTYSMASMPGYFYPYYILFALAGLYHGLHGTYLALGTLGVRVPQRLKKGAGFYAPIVVVGAGLVLAVLALGGNFFPIHDPYDNDFARLGERLLGESGGAPGR